MLIGSGSELDRPSTVLHGGCLKRLILSLAISDYQVFANRGLAVSRNAIRLRGCAGVVRRASGPRARGAEAMQLLLQTFELALRWTSYTS